MKNIEELIQEAGIDIHKHCVFDDVGGVSVSSIESFHKFAELLIKKCAILANRAENNDNELRCMYDVITEHFGVNS
jgi:hypothetical protein